MLKDVIFSTDTTSHVAVSISSDGGGRAPNSGASLKSPLVILSGLMIGALAFAVGLHGIELAPIMPVVKSISIGIAIVGIVLVTSIALRRAGAIVIGTALVGFGILLAAAMHVQHGGLVGYAMAWLLNIFGEFTPMIPISMIACGMMLFFGAASARVVSAISMGGASCLLILCALYNTGSIGHAIAGTSRANLGDLALIVDRTLLGIVAIGMSGIAPDDVRSAWLWASKAVTWPTIRLPRFRMRMKHPQPETSAYLPVARAVSAHIYESPVDAVFVETPIVKPVVYALPSPSLLEQSIDLPIRGDDRSADIERVFASFKVAANVKSSVIGPAVTQYRVEPAPGVALSKVEKLAGDLARGLSAKSVRIEAPIPGTPFIGVEVPNGHRASVCLGDVLDAVPSAAGALMVAVGKDLTGQTVIADLREMPHLLIAGSTGAGKSVCLNSMIATLLMRATPEQVRFVLIDPKRVELTPYAGIPHLLRPVVTDPEKAAAVLGDVVLLMNERYTLLEQAKAKNIEEYRAAGHGMPYLVVVIDEIGDLMMTAQKTVEPLIVRLAQLGRAAGIHLILATQRPSREVLTGLIKANVETRIAFSVSDATNARIILDVGGAEALLGKGDMLAILSKGGQPQRIQGAYISTKETARLVKHWMMQGNRTTEAASIDEKDATPQPSQLSSQEAASLACDALTAEIARHVFKCGSASKKAIMSQFGIGHAAVTRAIDELHELGVVGPAQGTRPRSVLVVDEAQLEDALRGQSVSHAA